MGINITLPKNKLTFRRYDRRDHWEELKSRNAGVYFLYDVEGSLLYVGKTRDFRNRLLSHFRGRDNSAAFYRLIDSVTLYFVNNEYEREVYETFSINTFQPEYNKSKAYFVDNSEELLEIEERLRDLAEEREELKSDMCDDGLVDRDFESDTSYLTGIYFHNQGRLHEINKEIKILRKRKSLLK